jgi:hypothetical protein
MVSGLAFSQATKKEAKTKEHAAKSGASVKDAVMKMNNELREDTLKGDPTADEKYLASDYHSIGGNGQAYTKEQVIDRLKSGAQKFSQINVANEDVAMYGSDVAIDHGEADVKATSDGKDASGRYHFARTWMKRNGKWQAIWFQTTKMQ